MNWKETLPVVAIVVLLAAAVVVYSAMTNPPAPEAPPDTSPAYFFITQTRHLTLDADNGRYAFAMYANYSASKVSSVDVEYLLLSEAPIRRVYLVDYPRVESPNYEAFESALSGKLAFYQISMRNITMADAMFLRNSVIIIPTGAVPFAMTQEESGRHLLDNGNALVLLGSPSMALKTDRSLVDIGDAFSAQVAGNKRFVQKPSLREGWGTPEDAAQDIFETVLYNSWQAPVATRRFSIPISGGEGKAALVSAVSANPGPYYASAILTARTVNASYADIGGVLDADPSIKLRGTLKADTDLFGNETLSFEYELHDTLPSATHLTLYTDIMRGDERISHEYLEDVNGEPEFFWHSKADKQLNLSPGDYELLITDQGGKQYAAAYLHVKSVEVRLLKEEDVYYTFAFYVDGNPVMNQKITVWIDNSTNSKEVTTDGNGAFTVPAGLSTGDHTFNFQTMGRVIRLPYQNTKQSIMSTITTYYAIAGIIIVVLLVATRRSFAPTWSIIADAPSPPKAKIVKITPSQFFRVLELYEQERGWKGMPLTIDDIFIAVKKYVTLDNKPSMATESNLLSSLSKLSKKGLVLHYMDYYLPAAWLNGKDYKRLCALRYLNDALIELGLTPEKEAGCDFSVKSPLGKSYLLIYNGQPPSDVLKLTADGRGVLLFADEEDLEAFEEKLLQPSPEWSKVALNAWNGRLYLILLTDFKKEFKA